MRSKPVPPPGKTERRRGGLGFAAWMVLASHFAAAIQFPPPPNAVLCRKFEDFLVDELDRQPRFFRPLPAGHEKGSYETSWRLEGVAPILEERFSPQVERAHFAAWFDEQDRPVRVDGLGRSRPFTAAISWEGMRTTQVHWRTFDASGAETEDVRWEIERDGLGQVSLVRVTRQGRTAWAEAYHPRSNGFLILAQFPGARVREIKLYEVDSNASGRAATRLKQRRFGDRNALFETASPRAPGTSSNGDSNFIPAWNLDDADAFRTVMQLEYRSFENVDRETLWFDGALPWQGPSLIRERGALPRVEYRRENRLVKTVELHARSGFSNALAVPASHAYDGYFDGIDFWGQFTIRELADERAPTAVESRVGDGLLRSVRWLDASGEVKRTLLDYFPDRTLMRERSWLRGVGPEERLFRAGPGIAEKTTEPERKLNPRRIAQRQAP